MTPRVTQIYFSPGHTTAHMAHDVAKLLGTEAACIDLLKTSAPAEQRFASDDLVVVAMPVFSGRIPSVCPAILQKFTGNNTPVVVVVAYGNREYEDALLELCDVLRAQGFFVIGAGAFVARHSIFPAVAEGRPDADDAANLEQFARKCAAKLKTPGAFAGTSANAVEDLVVKGNRPYRGISPLPLRPTGNSSCNRCNICVSICPTRAIARENPRKTDKTKCISCTACIYACPQHARSFRSLLYIIAKRAFQKKCSARKEPEWFT